MIIYDEQRVVPRWTYDHPDGCKKHFEYSNSMERSVAPKLFTNVKYAPDGYFPYYDYSVMFWQQTQIDQKAKITEISKKSSDFSIEIYRNDRLRKSALLLTTASYYLIMTNEFNKSNRFIKCRLVSTALLKYVGRIAIHNKEEYFFINPYKIPHVWVGDFLVNGDGTWNLSKVINKNVGITSQLRVYETSVSKIISIDSTPVTPHI